MNQLDLFSPPSMNPNRSELVPDCFRDYKQYEEWLYQARYAKEPITICEDCIDKYQVKMKSIGRCHYEWHSVKVYFAKQVKIDIKEKKAKEINLDPLSW